MFQDAEKYFEIINQNLELSQESIELNAEVEQLTSASTSQAIGVS